MLKSKNKYKTPTITREMNQHVELEMIVLKNHLYHLTIFIRKLPNAVQIIKKFSYQVGTENQELLHDLFDELYQKRLSNINVKYFLDICAAPGVYSKYILDKYPDASGVGISLDPKDGGHQFKIIDDQDLYQDRYQGIYQDVYQIDTFSSKGVINTKYDLCMTSCIPYDTSAKTVNQHRIIFKSLTVCLNSLKKNGTLIINFSFKDMIFAINFVYLISLLFKKIKLFKSTKLWILQRTFYVIGYDYQPNDKIINRINSYLENFDQYYYQHRDKLLPEINKSTLYRLMRMFESDVFMVQIQTYLLS